MGGGKEKRHAVCTSLPVLMHPFTSCMSPLPIILNRMILVRGSRTCSLVARSDLSFMFANELGPFLFTLTPMLYGTSIAAIRDEYFDRAVSWSVVLSCRGAVVAVVPCRLVRLGRGGLGWFTTGSAASAVDGFVKDVTACAFPVRTATCCRRRLYCFVKSVRWREVLQIGLFFAVHSGLTSLCDLPILIFDPGFIVAFVQ